MQLKLYIKQTDTYNAAGTQIYFDGPNPNSLKLHTGGLPSGRQWPGYGNYIEITGDTANLYKLKLTWTAERDDEGFITPGVSQATKAASGSLSIEGDAYKLLKKWLIDDVSAPLNSVDVKIEHAGCGDYVDFVIKAAEIKWCENEVCSFDVTLKQKDEKLSCIKSTYIADNHQYWFQTQPIGIKHPRFSYCNEHRPNGIMIMLWWISAVVTVPTLLVLIPLMVALNGIFAVINIIIGAVNSLIAILTGKPLSSVNWTTIPYFDFDAIKNAYGAYFVESAGCGKEHPAPLIRDYIRNVCMKCGVEVDENTAPVFFNPQMPVYTSSRGLITPSFNPHYNACYFYAPAQRGIRRFKSLNALRGIPNNTDYYIPDNAPYLTLDMFLDELKGLYNSEWRIKNGKLYFQRKDWYLQPGNLYDFSAGSADRLKILEGICYEWNELKHPATVQGLYTDDAADTCGNEAKKHMNWMMSYGSTDDNPTFEGISDKTVKFGATKFRLDGASEDYVYDAMQVIINSSLLTPFMAGLMLDFVLPSFEEFGDYALLLSDETCTMPKILIWDGERYDNARCIKTYGTRVMPPIPNGLYNSSQWVDRHPDETFVRGSGLTTPTGIPGYYVLSDIFGLKVVKKPAMLVNYPMYFEPGFYDTMWDWFHWIDDPNRNPTLHQNWSVKIDLCCDDLQNKLHLFGSSTGTALGEKVKLPSAYFNEGTLTHIEVSYDPTDNLGQYIELKGTV